MSEAPEHIVPSCVEALENYRQADMDGIMVLASRQAIHETIDAYWARVKTCAELEAKLAKAVEVLKEIEVADRTLETPSDYARGWNHGRFRYREIASAVLAEINGGGDT